MNLECPACGETEGLSGTSVAEGIEISCGVCGLTWTRDPSPSCSRCGSHEMFAATRAVIQKSRGTQLSVVGSQVVSLCEKCDADLIAHYLAIRPNPLMPDDLPNADGDA